MEHNFAHTNTGTGGRRGRRNGVVGSNGTIQNTANLSDNRVGRDSYNGAVHQGDRYDGTFSNGVVGGRWNTNHVYNNPMSTGQGEGKKPKREEDLDEEIKELKKKLAERERERLRLKEKENEAKRLREELGDEE